MRTIPELTELFRRKLMFSGPQNDWEKYPVGIAAVRNAVLDDLMTYADTHGIVADWIGFDEVRNPGHKSEDRTE